MPRTNLTKRNIRNPTDLRTKLNEHDTALDALETAAGASNADFKQSCRLATTGDHALSGVTDIDSVTPSAGDRILVKSQTAGAENGIYVAAAGAWARAADANASAEVTAGMAVFVSEGTINGNHWFDLTTDDAITLGTTALTFTKRPQLVELASTANLKGAALIGIEDSAAKITATTVEGALAEIAADGYVTAVHLGASAVEEAKINNGAVTVGKIGAGAVTIPKLAANVRGAPQLLSGAGAINLTTRTTLYTSTGASQALTLADGTETGQRKTIIHHVDGGDGVITAGGALHLGASIATITFTNVRDWVELEWDATNWNVVAFGGVTFA